jgi:hypothetical protein
MRGSFLIDVLQENRRAREEAQQIQLGKIEALARRRGGLRLAGKKSGVRVNFYGRPIDAC